jgi:hypothetical protein
MTLASIVAAIDNGSTHAVTLDQVRGDRKLVSTHKPPWEGGFYLSVSVSGDVKWTRNMPMKRK